MHLQKAPNPACIRQVGSVAFSSVPAALRKKHGIKEGTRIVISDNGDSIVLKSITEHYLKKLQGSLKGRGLMKSLMADRKWERNEA